MLTGLLLGVACSSPHAVPATDGAVAVHGPLATHNGQIVDAHGAALSLAGVSFFWSNKGWGADNAYAPAAYYNASVIDHLAHDWNAPIVRFAIGVETSGGYLDDPHGRWQVLTRAADAALARGQYFIVDWHSHNAHEHTKAAAEFFTRVARRYGHTSNLIYEIYNEPLLETSWSDQIKPYALEIIRTIRTVDRDNLIVVGTPAWSQRVDQAADDPIEGYDNIAYTLHFYAGTHGEALRKKARYAIDKKLPLMVTEWGTVSADARGSVAYEEVTRWTTFMREHKLTHCNWSLHSKSESASILTPAAAPDGRWSSESFTESGQLVRKLVSQWHAVDYWPNQ